MGGAGWQIIWWLALMSHPKILDILRKSIWKIIDRPRDSAATSLPDSETPIPDIQSDDDFNKLWVQHQIHLKLVPKRRAERAARGLKKRGRKAKPKPPKDVQAPTERDRKRAEKGPVLFRGWARERIGGEQSDIGDCIGTV